MDDWQRIGISFPVTCRTALGRDTRDVLELTRSIWEGHDYIPYVWRDWLLDPEGCLLVAEQRGKVVGLGKLSHPGPDEWWIEGLRVHPDFQGQKIARKLHMALIAAWEERGGGVLRLSTSSSRFAVHHLCQSTGFSKIAEFSFLAARSLPEAPGKHRRIKPDELELAFACAQQSPALSRMAGLVNVDWRWTSLSREIVMQAIQEGKAWWLGDQKGLILAWEDIDDDNTPKLVNRVIACELSDLAEIMLEFRRIAAAEGYPTAIWVASFEPDILTALNLAGYQSRWDGSAWIFAKAAES